MKLIATVWKNLNIFALLDMQDIWEMKKLVYVAQIRATSVTK